MRNPIWTTGDKKFLPVSDMSNTHVLNTHRFLCRTLTTLLSDLEERSLDFVPDGLKGRVFGTFSWISIFEQEILNRNLEPLITRPSDPMLDRCEPYWISDKHKTLTPVSQLSDKDLLDIHFDLVNQMVDLSDFYSFALGPLAPSEDTMASEHLNQCLYDSLSDEAFLADWIPTLTGEIRRRGLDTIPAKKPRPRIKIVSEEIMPHGGKIVQIELEQANQQEELPDDIPF